MIEIYVHRDVFLVSPKTEGVKPSPLGHESCIPVGHVATPGNDHVWDVLNVEYISGVRDAHDLRLAPGATVGLYPNLPPEGAYLVLLPHSIHQTGIQFSPVLIEFVKDVLKPLFIHNPNRHYVLLDLTQPIFVAIPLLANGLQ